MATLEAEVIVPPVPIEAQRVSKPAELANEPEDSAPPRVSVETRQGIVRRSKR